VAPERAAAAQRELELEFDIVDGFLRIYTLDGELLLTTGKPLSGSP